MQAEPIEAVGLRERKKARTREQLIEAALELFDRQGFEHTTVEEIAAAADVSPRTFFRYFASKEDVLLDDPDSHRAEVLARIEAAPVDEPLLRSLRTAFEALVGAYEHDPRRLLLRARIIRTTPSLRVHSPDDQRDKEEAFVQALVRRDAAAGRPPRLLEVRVSVGAAGAVLRAALSAWIEQDGEGNLRDLVGEAFDQLAAGVADRR
jgi:AcrR family transcriptional regulator